MDWIKCSERLPSHGSIRFVKKNDFVCLGYLANGEWRFYGTTNMLEHGIINMGITEKIDVDEWLSLYEEEGIK